eukprot:6884893-Alexandrium_andersonii.AAC.1
MEADRHPARVPRRDHLQGLGHVDLVGYAAAVTLRGLDVQLVPSPGHQEPHLGVVIELDQHAEVNLAQPAESPHGL